ncbi:hypothetical protein mRhiFer1_009358 [Rhinolophus ferrumequinum]|uniref:Uncharacterized protein n=1 Tax=Rhinolophus ferrumequinum TaxID=59479 RepID=A0A7J7RPM4_RHIFE|nr:hypothetical protein mRhiFer1_009358 [Rhinolophus ferrumequinum]
MRSGAVDAKAEVWVEKHVPTNRPQRPRRGRQPRTFWVGAEQKGSPSNPAIDPATRNRTPKGLPLCPVSTWRPRHERTHGPGGINVVLLARWAPPQPPLPLTSAKFGFPFPRNPAPGWKRWKLLRACLTGPLCWKKQIRHGRCFRFCFCFEKFNLMY